jgi:Zn-dependent protease
MGIESIFFIIVLVLSIVVHEAAHGFAANWLGDPTARLEGRLTINPFAHIDPMGSVIIPGILLLSGANLLFGWAKPVPYNPHNLRNKRWGEALVAGAGPFVNVVIAVVFAIMIRFSDTLALPEASLPLIAFVVYLNLLLALFNMVPVPPLDGSKILKSLLPIRLMIKFRAFEEFMYRYGILGAILFLFIFITLLWPFFSAFLGMVFTLLTGTSM